MSDGLIDGVYYPPEGIYFRLYNKSWDYCIYARDHPTPHTGTVWRNYTDYQDQYFTLVRQGDYWSLKNKATGKYLEARIQDNDWTYHSAKQTENTAMRLVKPSKNGWDGFCEVIFHSGGPRSSLEGWLRCNNDGFWTPKWSGPHTEDGDQQFWSLLYEDMEFVDIEFDTAKKSTENKQQVILSTGDNHVNKSPVNQNDELKFSENVSHTSEFNWGFGISAKIETSATVKFPGVFEGGSKVEYGGDLHFDWGKKETNAKEYSFVKKFTIPPWCKMRMRVSVTKGDMTIPFVVNYKSRSTGQKCKAWGEWKGTVSWDILTENEVIEKYTPH